MTETASAALALQHSDPGDLGVLEAVMREAQRSSVLTCIAPRGGRIDVPGRLAVLPRKRLDTILCEAAIQAGARTMGISIEPTTKDKNGKLVSVHGTQVVAFSPKTNGGYLLYDQDATVDDYTKDLPKIVKGENP